MRSMPELLPVVYPSRLTARCSKVKEGRLGSFKPGMEMAVLEIDWRPMRIAVGVVRIVARVAARPAAHDLFRLSDWMPRPNEAMIAEKRVACCAAGEGSPAPPPESRESEYQSTEGPEGRANEQGHNATPHENPGSSTGSREDPSSGTHSAR